MTSPILCTVDQGDRAFEQARFDVSIVCSGDSLTGWNNSGPHGDWPFPTYPDFLQKLCEPLRLRVANGGIAGEISDNGPTQVADYLDLFPNARFFIMGMGTNDLAMSLDTASTSSRILANLDKMAQSVGNRGKQPILFNVPNVNERVFPPSVARLIRATREYHNPRLKQFCIEHCVPLADICSQLGDEHFADSLHPNEEGAKIIASSVFEKLLWLTR